MTPPAMRISDQVADQLLALVREHQLQPGHRLPAERPLAEALGVSRTALREAIQKLGSQGILMSRMGAGTFVHNLPVQKISLHDQLTAPLAPLMRHDPQYLYDVLETRQMLEVHTAWHAACRATEQDKSHIQRRFDELLHYQHIQNTEAAALADAQFHLAIAEASHNAVVVQVMRSLFDLVRNTVAENRRLMFVDNSSKVLEQLTMQHHRLVLAIVAGEPEEARSVITEHLAFVLEKLSEADANIARRQRLDRLTPSALKSTP